MSPAWSILGWHLQHDFGIPGILWVPLRQGCWSHQKNKKPLVCVNWCALRCFKRCFHVMVFGMHGVVIRTRLGLLDCFIIPEWRCCIVGEEAYPWFVSKATSLTPATADPAQHYVTMRTKLCVLPFRPKKHCGNSLLYAMTMLCDGVIYTMGHKNLHV